MTKTPFSKEKALKSAIVSNQIEGYVPIKDKVILNYMVYLYNKATFNLNLSIIKC